MIGALLYLQSRTFLNRQKLRLRRLKKPKYLIGAIVGGLYFYFYFFRFVFHAVRKPASTVHFPTEQVQLMEPLGAGILLVIVLLAWIFPHGRAALTFTEAEINFLFPAPVSRRTLVQFKLLKSQISILFTTLLLTLFTGRLGSGGAWIRILGWWIILSTLNLHFLGSSFARSMLLEHGISNWKRRLYVLLFLAGFSVIVFLWAKQTIPTLNILDLRDVSVAKEFFHEVARAGPVPWLLFPFQLVVRPFFATGAAEFLRVLWPALAVMLLHYVWVLRANVAFEEASVEVSQRLAERTKAVRAGNFQPRPTKSKRSPFPLAPTGPPAIALLWKNLIAAGQMFTMRFWIIIAVTFGPLLIIGTRHHSELRLVLGYGCLLVLFWSLLIGPQILRYDFRHDLPIADILKSFPMRGWQLVLGELLAPAVALTAIQWLLILGAAALLGEGSAQIEMRTDTDGFHMLSLPWRLSLGLGIAIVVPLLDFVSLIIPNASVLLFPGWFQAGKDGPQGIEATGQRLIFMLGQLLVFVLSILPAAVAFAVIFFPLSYLTHRLIAVPIASVGAALALSVECTFAVVLLGKVFEKFDLSAES